MTSVFWDAQEVLLIYDLEKSKTINSECYCNFLDNRRKNSRRKKSFFIKMHPLSFTLNHQKSHKSNFVHFNVQIEFSYNSNANT